jgi:hypothetical protein
MARQIELRLASQEIHLQTKIGTPTLKEASRDLVESFISHLATAAKPGGD